MTRITEKAEGKESAEVKRLAESCSVDHYRKLKTSLSLFKLICPARRSEPANQELNFSRRFLTQPVSQQGLNLLESQSFIFIDHTRIIIRLRLQK